MSQVYRIEHKTEYTYDADVSASYGLAYARPRDLPDQTCLVHELRVDPDPSDQYSITDVNGNVATYFHVTSPHQRLLVRGLSVVEVRDPTYDEAALALPWEQARPLTSDDPDAWRAVDFTLESPLIDINEDVFDYAAVSFPAGRPIGEAVDDLNHRIYADFDYNKNATTVTTRVPDVLEKRAGVCQDFAQLLIACLRSHGLAGQYVSGYLATRPPPGKPRLVGADATHAWASCWIPGGRWLAVDPTNNKRCNDAHATVAWGRDYRDVPPVRGVIFTDAKDSKMKVSVDMAPLSEFAVSAVGAASAENAGAAGAVGGASAGGPTLAGAGSAAGRTQAQSQAQSGPGEQSQEQDRTATGGGRQGQDQSQTGDGSQSQDQSQRGPGEQDQKQHQTGSGTQTQSQTQD